MPSPIPVSTKRTIYEWEVKLSSRKAKLTYTDLDGFNLKIHEDDPEHYLITRADLSLLSTMLMEAYVDLAPAPPQP